MKIGDTVQYIGKTYCVINYGIEDLNDPIIEHNEIGVIIFIKKDAIGVKFIKYNKNKNNLSGNCPDGYGWVLDKRHLKKYISPPTLKQVKLPKF